MKRYVKAAGSPPAQRAGGPATHASLPVAPHAAAVPTWSPSPAFVPPPVPATLAPYVAFPTSAAPLAPAPVPSLAPPVAYRSEGGCSPFILLVLLVMFAAPCVVQGQGLPEAPAPGAVFDLDASPIPPAPSETTPSLPDPRNPETDGGCLLACAILLGIAAGRRSTRRATRPPTEPSPPSPQASPPPKVRRTLGAHSATGNTRESNQDRVRTERIDGLDVIVAGDGLGGLPHGAEAAEVATTFALEHLRAELPRAHASSFEAARTLLLSTVWAAASALTREAAERNWLSFDDGFRTTLILVVTTTEWHVAAWIGDGGIFLIRDGGDVLAVLEPHKDPATPDVLDASLGPCSDGRPSWAVAPRLAGDVLLVATDGVADVFDASAVPALRAHLARADGDAVVAAEAIVTEHAARRDDAGHYCVTDNLTVAIATTEKTP